MNEQIRQFQTMDLIAQFIKLRDKLEAIEKEHEQAREKATAPYKTGMRAIEGMLTQRLLELGPDEGKRNISTPAGTVYRKKWESVEVADRESFIEFVFNTESTQFVTNHVSKTAVLEHMQTHNGMTPPGIGYEAGYKTQILRSTKA